MAHLGIFYHAARQFAARDMPYYAAAFSYYAPLALIPLILFSLLVASFFYSPSFVAGIFQSWGTVLGSDLLALVNVAVQNLDIEIKTYSVPVFALAFFMSVSILAFNVLGTGFGRMWDTYKKGLHAWISQTTRSASFVIILEAYILFIIGAEGLLSYLKIDNVFLLSEIIWFLSISLVFVFLYRFLAASSPSWKGCFFAGGVAGLLFILSNSMFTIYLSTQSVLSIFGAAGLILVLLVWVYVLASIILYGAAVAELYDKMLKSKERNV